MVSPDNSYTRMQKAVYAQQSQHWSFQNRDAVVGTFDLHNQHPDYQLLFQGIDTAGKVALDFGCGPGRNIVLFNDRFARIDGVDLDPVNIENARKWADHHGCKPNLFLCSGVDLQAISSEEYDVVFSTICMQHICVHEIRQNYWREFYRVLKPGGWVSVQMGFGANSQNSVGYYDNYYAATTTNRGCDTRVEDPAQLAGDLEKVGFKNFRYVLRPPGPGDYHPQWIFFQAERVSV